MSDYIPDHNLAEILRWLPVKSLLRFRCVSKSWKKIIDSESFTQGHLVVQKPQLIVQLDEQELLILDPQTLPSFKTIKNERDYVIGTLHGVVCLFDYKSSFRLWNPSTCKSLTLPEPDRDFACFDRDHDACQYHTYTSFWIDPFTKQFKVILFNMEIEGYDLFYSSAQHKWSVPPLGMIEGCTPLKGYRSVIIRGVAYWGALNGFIDEENKICNVVVIGFDFVEERFELIKAPCVKEHQWSEPILYKWQDELSLAYVNPEMTTGDVFIRHQDSWVCMFRIELASNVSRVLWTMGGMNEMKEIRWILGTKIKNGEVGEVMLCDTKCGCVSLWGGLHYDIDKFIFVTCDFVESLLLP